MCQDEGFWPCLPASFPASSVWIISVLPVSIHGKNGFSACMQGRSIVSTDISGLRTHDSQGLGVDQSYAASSIFPEGGPDFVTTCHGRIGSLARTSDSKQTFKPFSDIKLATFPARSWPSPAFPVSTHDDSNTRFKSAAARASGDQHPRSQFLDRVAQRSKFSKSCLSMFSSCSVSFTHMDTRRSNTTASVCTCPPLLASCMDFPLWRAFEPPELYRVMEGGRRGGGAGRGERGKLWKIRKELFNT